MASSAENLKNGRNKLFYYAQKCELALQSSALKRSARGEQTLATQRRVPHIIVAVNTTNHTHTRTENVCGTLEFISESHAQMRTREMQTNARPCERVPTLCSLFCVHNE